MDAFHQKTKGPRACSTCAKAKARCIPGPDASKCERCHRLNKTCPSQTPAAPRYRKEPKTTRVAELERRLEDLTSRIETAQKQQQVPSPPESNDSAPASHRPISLLPNPLPIPCLPRLQHLFPAVPPVVISTADAGNVRQRTNSWTFTNAMFTPGEYAPVPEATHRPAPVSLPVAKETSIWPMGEDAEGLLADYRHMEHLFPFVVVPPRTTSGQLRQQRPFLWKAVMMEACHLDGPRQIALGNQLLRDITEAAFTKPQKSIDLLQGLQVLISWFHYNLNSFQMTNLLYMARSICMSLGFNELQGAVKQSEHSSHCLEQMRAFSGTYYLVTVIFTTNKKPDSLMNTSYLEACCRILETRMEYETDDLLVWLVRAQQLAQSISMTLAFRANTSLKTADLPLNLIIKSFQQQLESFKSSVPARLKDNPSLVGHQHVAGILLYEIGLQENSGLAVADRLEFLWACVTASKAFFGNQFVERVAEQPRFICMCSFDFIYAFLIVLKLVTLSIPGWDLKIVGEELKFDELVDKQIEDMELLADRRVKGFSAQDNSDASGPAQDPFRKLAEKLKMLRDVLCGEMEMMFNDNLAKAATTGAMTVTDATQGIMEDLEGSLWQSLMGAAADWESFDSIPFQGIVF